MVVQHSRAQVVFCFYFLEKKMSLLTKHIQISRYPHFLFEDSFFLHPCLGKELKLWTPWSNEVWKITNSWDPQCKKLIKYKIDVFFSGEAYKPPWAKQEVLWFTTPHSPATYFPTPHPMLPLVSIILPTLWISFQRGEGRS